MACPAMDLSLYLVSVVGDPSSMGVHFFQLGRKFPERWEYVLCTCRKNTSKVSYYNDNDGDDDDGGWWWWWWLIPFTKHTIHTCSSFPDNYREKYYLSNFTMWKYKYKEFTEFAQGTPGRKFWSLGVFGSQPMCLRTNCYYLQSLARCVLAAHPHPRMGLFKCLQFVTSLSRS